MPAALQIIASHAQLPYDLINLKRHTIQDAASRGAVCNDGSPAAFFFRDCPRPADECAGWSNDWLVFFADGAAADACYDQQTCDARKQASPDKMTATHLNATLLSPGGIFSVSGEENPNFYGFRTVLVPYCSSDMWVGNGSAAGYQFRGLAIAKAVIEDLARGTFSPSPVPTPFGPGPSGTRLAAADSITIIGGAGVMSQLTGSTGGALAALLPSTPRRNLRLICDGCVLPDVAPLVSVGSRPCTTAADCPPRVVLRRGFALWGGDGGDAAASGAGLASWQALLASALLPALALPTLVQQPLYGETLLRQQRAWPVASANQPYVERFGRAVAQLLKSRPHGGRWAFGAACSPAHPSLLRDADAFFCCPVTCTLQSRNTSAALHLASMTSMFVKDPDAQPACVDTCDGVDCNRFCESPSCFGPG